MTHEHDHEPPPEEHPGSDDGAPPPDDVDTAFAAIVAQFSDGAPQVGPWSAAEDLEPGDADGKDTGGKDADGPVASGEGAGRDLPTPGGDAVNPFPPPAAEDDRRDAPEDPDEDGFVPPDPQLPRGDLVTRLAWAGVIGGPLGLLLAAVTRQSVSTSFLAVTVGAFVAGFLVLVARLPTEHPDDPDDGAVV